MRKTVMLAGAAMAALLGACSKTGCAGLSDREAVARIAQDYARQPASTRGDASQMRLEPERVRGVGRGQGQIQAWFGQADGTLTVAILTDDCRTTFRPGLAADAIARAAIPARPPRF